MVNKEENTVKYIKDKSRLIAIILKSNFTSDTTNFFTPSEFSQQLGYMKHPKKHVIIPHTHNFVSREVNFTKEVLFIKSGKIRVDFYDDEKNYFESTVLNQGDVILLAFGGHGFEMLEASEIIEVKQGPYAEEKDKTRFDPVSVDKIKIKD